MRWEWAAAVAAAMFAATFGLTGRLRQWLVARAILDYPVARSSHREPMPRGGGLVLVPVLLAGWLVLSPGAPRGEVAVIVVAALLAALSWHDDRNAISVPLRLACHAVAVAAGLVALPRVFPVPLAIDRAAVFVLWLWFVELYNFMDGIDGLAASETGMLGGGIALVLAAAGGSGGGIAALALAAAAAGAGFLRWNWYPARIFLGDVGAVPLGYLMGWLLLELAARGFWAAAAILPLYYVADATITLSRRVARREKFWQPHREHFYQRAVGPDGNHATVVRFVVLGDAALVGLALVALHHAAAALALAALLVAAMLAVFERRAARG